MFFRVKKIHPVISSLLLVLSLMIFGPIGTAEAAALIDAPSADPPTLTPIQHYPYRYPPGYNPPAPNTYQGTRGAKGSGWVFIEVDPGSGRVYRRPQAGATGGQHL